MAFQGLKFPRSRRQVWEISTNRSQFSCVHDESNYTTESKDHGDRLPHQGDLVDCAAGVELASREVAESAHSTGHRSGSKPDPCEEELPVRIRFSVIDLVFVAISVILYIGDIGLDFSVAYKHYLEMDSHPLYFIFTLTFIFLSSTVTTIYSLWWYYFEYQTKKSMPANQPSRYRIAVNIIASIFMMGPVLRYIDTIRYGLQSRKKCLSKDKRQYYSEQMTFERVDGAMLRLFEAFLEAAPQLLLQVFIILREGLTGEKEGNTLLVVTTIASICSSMLSLAWSIVAYHKALRMSRYDRDNISHCGLFFRFLWRLFEVAPRVIIFAMFMSTHGGYLGAFMGIHFVVMFIWLTSLKTNFCEKGSCEIFFVGIMALIWIFTFFNVKDGHTRFTSLLYYSLFYVENVTLTVLWATATKEMQLSVSYIVIGSVLGAFWVAVFFMVLYYKYFHPKRVPTCLPRSYWINSITCSNEASRYELRDGDSTEREILTNDIKVTSPSLNGNHKTEEPEFEGLTTLTPDDMPAYRAPTPDRPPPSPQPAQNGRTIPNLDGYVEGESGYLEVNELESDPPLKGKLGRQDTMPKYQAPVPRPNQTYGSTIPGGTGSLLSYRPEPLINRLHGSTLPGAPSGDFIEEMAEPLSRSQLRVSGRAPLPEPRHSHSEHETSGRLSPPLTVDDLSLSEDSVMNSPGRTLDESGVDMHTPARDELRKLAILNTTESSVDTPVKRIIVGSDSPATDTPAKDSVDDS